MANIRANEKTLRKSVKKRTHHKSQKTTLKNQLKTAKQQKSPATFVAVQSTVDKLARKGTISTARANRLKSRLARTTANKSAVKTQPRQAQRRAEASKLAAAKKAAATSQA